MRLRKSWCLVIALIAGLSTAAWTHSNSVQNQNSSAVTNDGKIPISTKSAEARKEFLLGRDLFDRGLVPDAIPHFEKAISLDPDFASAELARANSAVRDPKGAFEHVQKAVSLADKVSEGERLLILATEAELKGDPMKWKGSLEKLVAAYPNDERAENELATFYFATQQYQLAIDHSKKTTALAPNFAPAYDLLGYSYREQGDYADAESAFKKYTELIPDSPDPYDAYAELLLKMGKFEESIAQYRKALAINPKFESSRYGISADEMYLGRPEAAQAILQEMADKAENESDQRAAYFGMAILYCDAGKFDQALKPVDKMYDLSVERKDPTAIALVLQLQGWIMMEMGNHDGAKRKFDGALQSIETSNLPQEVKDNWTVRHHLDLAALAIAQKDYAAAKAHAAEFRQGAEHSKDPGELQQVHEMAGRIALAENDYANAVVELQQADLQDARNLYWLGLAYQGKGDAAKAKDFFAKAAGSNSLPSIHYAFIRAKVLKMVQNKAVEGKDPALQSLYDQHRWFELRQMINGRDAPAFYKGAVASAFNDAVAAEKYLHEAVNLHPNSDSAEDAHSMLASLHMRSGQYKRAAEQLDDILKLKPEDADAQNARVLFEAWSKHPDQSTLRVRSTTIHADIKKDGVKLPVLIHGKTVHWLLDTGANFSLMSESEARMLGVGVDETSASVADSAGGSAKMRTAVVNELAIGGVQMRNVAFLILPDSQEPMSDWPRGERGVIGIQIATALQSIRWNRDGVFEVSSGSRQSTKDDSDLCFDGLSPVTRVQFEGKELDFQLDTGDQSGSQLWTRFANDFPTLVKQRGSESKQEIKQVGGANERATIVLPEIPLRIGGLNTALRPAQVFSKPVGDDFHHGLIGMDLLSQAREVRIDFVSMTLELLP